MKTRYFFILFVFAFLSVKKGAAQGNLQFNQVILYDIPISGTQNITVPAGKVWKIESVSMGSTGSSADIFLRNSTLANFAHFSAASAAASAVYPFWLPANFTGSFLNNNPSFRCCVSIIEFNIVP